MEVISTDSRDTIQEWTLSLLYRLTGNCEDFLRCCRKRQRNRQRTKNNEAGLHKVPTSVEGRILSSDEDVQCISAGHLQAHALLDCCTVLHRAFRVRICQEHKLRSLMSGKQEEDHVSSFCCAVSREKIALCSHACNCLWDSWRHSEI